MKLGLFVSLLLAATSTGALAQAGYGFDTALVLTTADVDCLMDQQLDVAIFRAYHSYGAPDTNAPTNLATAYAAGIKQADVYLYPCVIQCPSGPSASEQFNDMISMLTTAGATWSNIWFDIEDTLPDGGVYWSNTNVTANQVFYQELVSTCAASGYKCGVYSNSNFWTLIFGSISYNTPDGVGASNPLWYVGYTGNEASYLSYIQFGQWITPSMKQFNGTAYICGFEIDLDWYSNAAALWTTNSSAVATSAPSVPATPGYGIDMSTVPSLSQMECLIAQGFTTAIFRAFHSSGVPDTNVNGNLATAYSAGITRADVYMFPCPTCSATASAQVSAMMTQLAGCTYGIIWLDIEEDYAGEYWSTSTSSNQAWFNELATACIATGSKCGVYSNQNNWITIFGSSTWVSTAASGLPIWYAYYDNVASFAEFPTFGGWTTPDMKQYNGTATICGVGVDLDWYSNANAIWGSPVTVTHSATSTVTRSATSTVTRTPTATATPVPVVPPGPGFDLSSATTLASMQCMAAAGFERIVIRAYHSSGIIDTNAVTTIGYANQAGIPVVDVYIFPCATCAIPAANQVAAVTSNLASVSYGTIWLIVQETTAGSNWNVSTSGNQAFYAALVSACQTTGHPCGVFSNSQYWNVTFGSTAYQIAGGPGSLQLWYGSTDGQQNYNDFAPFAGWTAPVMKQYNVSTGTTCSLSVDFDWYTNSTSSTASSTATAAHSATGSSTATWTAVHSATASSTATSTAVHSATRSATATATATATPTPAPSASQAPLPSAPSTSAPSTSAPSTIPSTTSAPSTIPSTTSAPSTIPSTTSAPSTIPSTIPSTTSAPSTPNPTVPAASPTPTGTASAGANTAGSGQTAMIAGIVVAAVAVVAIAIIIVVIVKRRQSSGSGLYGAYGSSKNYSSGYLERNLSSDSANIAPASRQTRNPMFQGQEW